MERVWSCFFVVAFVCVTVTVIPAGAVVGGAPAAAPEPDAAVVFTQKYGRSARIQGLKFQGYYSFFGIRYAEPPVGPRRFQRPVRRILIGEQNVTKPCPMCPQPDPSDPRKVVGHEDCLCLNVFAPKMPGDEKGSPVVFFIHGGNYRTGTANTYGGKHFAQEDTILVVAQYRLGSLGFISNGQKEATGNAGLFDLQVAIAWVKDYIEFFGGDPTSITIMGQGTGGSAASVLALSAEDRSSSGVVALSGTPLSPGAIRSEPEKHAQALAKQTGCPEEPVERLVMCLRKLPMEKIIQADSAMIMNFVDTNKFLEEIIGRSGFGVRVEGEDDKRGLPPLVTEQPADALKKKRQTAPFLTGVTSAETARAVFGKYRNELTNQLMNVNNFIKKDILGGLNNLVKGVEGLLPIKTVAPDDLLAITGFQDYYDRFSEGTNDIIEGLSAIAEATGDALFNFPAFKSVQEWGMGAPAFLYSFEFVGNLTKGSHFLPGVPLAAQADNDEVLQTTKSGPSHGDELAYLFDPLDQTGKSIEADAQVSQTDSHVRNNFVKLISQFAHDLKGFGRGNGSSIFPDFSALLKKSNSFIKINENIGLDENFRFCQMATWGNMADRIKDTICQDLLKNLLNLKLPVTLLKPLTPARGGSTSLLPTVNLLGKQNMIPQQNKRREQNTPSIFGLQ